MFAMIQLKTNTLKYKNKDGSMVGFDAVGGKQIVDSELSTESINPVQNKIVTEAIERLSEEKVNKQQGVENAKTLLCVDDVGNVVNASIGTGLELKANSRKNIFHGEWVNAEYRSGVFTPITSKKNFVAVNELYPVEAGAKYTFSVQIAAAWPEAKMCAVTYAADKSFINNSWIYAVTATSPVTFTVPTNVAYISLYIYGNGAPWEALVPVGLMIEKGSVATEYEAFSDSEMVIQKADSASIIGRNEDVYPLVQAAARRGYNGDAGVDCAKQFTMLAITDVHHDIDRYASALEYMDAIAEVDCGICLGDMQSSYFTDNDGTWFTSPINAARKKMYPVIGNHDAGMTTDPAQAGSKQQQFDKFFAPIINKLGMPDLTKTYYSFDTGYGVTVIVLDAFDAPDTLDSDGNFVYERVKYGYSQEQVNFLVDALANVPAGNHVLIALHVQVDPTVMVEGNWSNPIHFNGGENTGYDYTNMIPEIVDAWQRGAALNKEYTPKMDSTMPTLTVNADFATRGEGVFAGYLRGHTHSDGIAYVKEYPTQNIYSLDCTVLARYQNRKSDLPRIVGKKSEDAITVVTIDTISRCVKLVRVGSNITFDMVRRDMIAIQY